MRLLLVAPNLPWPLETGGQQRTYALLRALAHRHEVTLSTPPGDGDVAERLRGLERLVARFLPAPPRTEPRPHLPIEGPRWRRLAAFSSDVLRARPPYGLRIANRAWIRLLAAERLKCDGVVCRSTSMMDAFQMQHPRSIVVDADDLYYVGMLRYADRRTHGWGSLLYGVESFRSYFYEQRIFTRVARTLVCSDTDSRRILTSRKSIVRNGIIPPDPEQMVSAPHPHVLVFVGTFGYPPNVQGLEWFVRHVWPELRRQQPESQLHVIGSGPREAVTALASVPGVTLVGKVRHTEPHVTRGVVSIVPLLVGMGTRIKILESLACGRPVVSTRVGAEGIDLGEEQGLIRVDEPLLMARRLVELLADPHTALQRAAVGRRAVLERFTWEATTRGLAENVEQWLRPHDGRQT